MSDGVGSFLSLHHSWVLTGTFQMHLSSVENGLDKGIAELNTHINAISGAK